MVARRFSRVVLLGLWSIAIKTLSPSAAKVTGTRCGWAAADTVARRATRAVTRRWRASPGERRIHPCCQRQVRVACGVPGSLVGVDSACTRGPRPVNETESYGLTILIVGLVGTAAVLSNRASERLRIPAPAFFLVFAAAASDLFPGLGRLTDDTVQRVVTVALAFILFDGGMHIGWRKFRTAASATRGV